MSLDTRLSAPKFPQSPGRGSPIWAAKNNKPASERAFISVPTRAWQGQACGARDLQSRRLSGSPAPPAPAPGPAFPRGRLEDWVGWGGHAKTALDPACSRPRGSEAAT